jgi:hypothetical protein
MLAILAEKLLFLLQTAWLKLVAITTVAAALAKTIMGCRILDENICLGRSFG